MSSEKFPVGKRIVNPEGVEGTVVTNVKFPGDICVVWDGYTRVFSYDEDFLDEHCKEPSK